MECEESESGLTVRFPGEPASNDDVTSTTVFLGHPSDNSLGLESVIRGRPPPIAWNRVALSWFTKELGPLLPPAPDRCVPGASWTKS